MSYADARSAVAVCIFLLLLCRGICFAGFLPFLAALRCRLSMFIRKTELLWRSPEEEVVMSLCSFPAFETDPRGLEMESIFASVLNWSIFSRQNWVVRLQGILRRAFPMLTDGLPDPCVCYISWKQSLPFSFNLREMRHTFMIFARAAQTK